MKFILRLGLALLTGFVSVSTASAQAYGTADTNTFRDRDIAGIGMTVCIFGAPKT